MAISSDAIGLIFRASGDTDDARKAYSQLRESIISDIRATETAGSRGFGGLTNSINISGESISNLGQKIGDLGRTLTVSLTLPLAALAGLGTKSALEFDAIRTKITALVGDSELAATKIAELRDVAQDSVGTTQLAALETYAQLKGIGGVTDETINKMIGSLGKLNAAFKIEDLAGFNQNLVQIFSQGFERADIKEAIGRVPFFEQLLEQAFGTKDAEKLKELKAAGKLTLDTFLEGISGAISSDPRIKDIQDNLTVRLAKGWERISMALVPLGETILNLVLPAIDKLIPYIESLARWFQNAGPAIQIAVVAVGAFLAALGPALVVIGGVVAAIGSIVTAVAAMGGVAASLTAIGIAVLAVIGFLIQIGPVIVIVTAQIVLLYQAWQTNFGGIRDFTIQAWNAIRNAFQSAMSAIVEITNRLGTSIVSWWERNWPLIQQTVETVSEAIKTTVQALLDAIQAFWDDHGEKIIAYVSFVWEQISTVVETVLTQIGNVIRLAMQVINGDWQGAWDSLLNIIQTWVEGFVSLLSNMVQYARDHFGALVLEAISAGVQFVFELRETATRAVTAFVGILATLPYRLIQMIPQFIAAGKQIGAAIWNGIRNALLESSEEQPLPDLGLGTGVSYDRQAGGSVTPSIGRVPIVLGSGGGSGSSGANEAEKLQREAKARRDNQANLTIEKNTLAEIQKNYAVTIEEIRKRFRESRDISIFNAEINQASQNFSDNIRVSIVRIQDFERKLLAADALESEKNLLHQQQVERLTGLEDDRKELDKKNAEEVAKVKRQIWNEQDEVAKAQFDAMLKLYELEQKQLQTEREKTEEFRKQGLEVADRISREREEEERKEAERREREIREAQGDLDDFGGGILSGAVDGMGLSIEKMLEKVEPLKGIGNIIGSQFNVIAQAVGNAVKAFVLFGSAGGSFKKFAAEILASIAQMAIVQAVWELAQGFAMLALSWFTGNPKYGASATAHFTAAAIYGVVGGVAAVAGRAVAGDSFQQESQGGFGSSGQPSRSNRNTTNQGRAFSGFGDEATIIDTSRNAPSTEMGVGVELRLKDKSNWFSDMFEVELNSNGKLRRLVLDAAAS